MTRRNVLLALVVLLLVTAAAAVVVWREWRRTDFAAAASLLPADTLRASWTDWSRVREDLGASVSAEASGDEIRAFMDSAFERDLTVTSTMTSSAVALQREFGFSPATVEWELLGQSREGAVVMLKPSADVLDGLGDRLRDLGYTEERGIFVGGADLMPQIDPTITPELQYVAVLSDEGLVLTADNPDYLATAAAAASGDGDRLASEVVQDLGEPLAAVAFLGDFACEALSMGQADPEDQSVATNLVEDAGGINPVTGYAVAAYPSEAVRVVLDFENDDQATANGSSRAALASGPAPGQGLAYPELFSVDRATVDGTRVTLELTAAEGSFVLSELTSGPVLLATC